MNKTTWKSVGAIVAGVLAIIVVTTLIDLGLHAAGIYPPMDQPINDVQALIASSYRLVIGVAGAWLAARLAPARPRWHALLLGYVGVVLALAGLVATWNLGLGPRWYPVSLAVLALPQCWLGGWIYARRLPAPAGGQVA